MTAYRLIHGGVLRDDVAAIPADADNRDWQAYQAWIAAGGVPDPAPAPSAAELIAAAWDATDAACMAGADRNARERYSRWESDRSSSPERLRRIAAVWSWIDARWAAYDAWRLAAGGPSAPLVQPDLPCPFTFREIAAA